MIRSLATLATGLVVLALAIGAVAAPSQDERLARVRHHARRARVPAFRGVREEPAGM